MGIELVLHQADFLGLGPMRGTPLAMSPCALKGRGLTKKKKGFARKKSSAFSVWIADLGIWIVADESTKFDF